MGDSTYPWAMSLTETLLLHDAGGIVAAVAPTGLSEHPDALVLNQALVQALFNGDWKTLGEALQQAQAILLASGGKQFMAEIYSVNGDPAIKIH